MLRAKRQKGGKLTHLAEYSLPNDEAESDRLGRFKTL